MVNGKRKDQKDRYCDLLNLWVIEMNLDSTSNFGWETVGKMYLVKEHRVAERELGLGRCNAWLKNYFLNKWKLQVGNYALQEINVMEKCNMYTI